MLGIFDEVALKEKLYYAAKQAPRNAPALVELLERATLRGMRSVQKKAAQQIKEELPKFDAMQALEIAIHRLPTVKP